MKSSDIKNFVFLKVGNGSYSVQYRNKRGDYYHNIITDMTLIDDVKNVEQATTRAMERLRDAVKKGAHYNKYGERIE